MSVIVLNDKNWFCSGAGFRQVIDTIRKIGVLDPHLDDKLSIARDVKGLFIDHLDPTEKEMIHDLAIKAVKIIITELEASPKLDEWNTSFLESLRNELLPMLKG